MTKAMPETKAAPELKAALADLLGSGLTTEMILSSLIMEGRGEMLLRDCLCALQSAKDGFDRAAVAAAQKHYAKEGVVEVDANAITSRGDDEEGTYVLAWVWVDRAKMDLPPTCACGATEDVISTPCGSMCRECYQKHRADCEVCDKEDL